MDFAKLKDLAAKVSVPPGTPMAAKKDTTGTLYLYSDIGPAAFGGTDAKALVSALEDLRGVKVVQLHVNSVGGSVFEAMAMYAALKDFPAKVEVYVDGLAASAASIVAMAGDEIVMAPEAQVMIHLPWTMTGGNAADLREMADLLDRNAALLAQVYAKRTGLPAEELTAMMAAETWMNAEEAVSKGFADRIAGQDAPAQRVAAQAAPTVLAIAQDTQRRLSEADYALARMSAALLKHKVGTPAS